MTIIQPCNQDTATAFTPIQKGRIVATGMWITWNSNMGSSLPSGAMEAIRRDFSIQASSHMVWLNSLYLLGYAVGPVIFGPLSEHIGRRPVLLGTYLGYLIFTMACALSNHFGLLLFFRFCTGLVGSAPNAVTSGLFADIFEKHRDRGKVMMYFVCAAVLGPLFGPLVSGLTEGHSWQLSFWVGLAIAGIGLPLVLFLPETFPPVLQSRMRSSARGGDYDGTQDSNRSARNLAAELKIVFTRPYVMIAREPMVLSASLYLTLVYSILYLFFQAYPIIFNGLYGLSPKLISAAYAPVAVGSLTGLILGLWYDVIYASRYSRRVPWALNPDYRRLPLACIGAPCIVVALFWLGWTSRPSIHVVLPMVSGFWFGLGYFLIFVGMVNYLTDAYKTYASSANAAASTTRALGAAFLPFAASPMFGDLGIQWACSLLGFLALAMSVVPFVFLRFGATLRERSPFCQKLLISESEDSAGPRKQPIS